MSETKTVLVTGAAGFIGRHVTERLEERGHEVLKVDVFEERVHGLTPSMVGVEPTLSSATPYAMLREAEVVIHLAAQVGVADSMEDPLRYVLHNTLDTTEFLLSLQRYASRLERIVTASSMSIYGAGGLKVSESDPAVPASVYGLTKLDQERLTLLLAPTESVALRFFNVYGPGQALSNPYTGVLAIFANALLNGEQPTVFEDGQQTRDFIYVEDVARAVCEAALAPSVPSDVYNVCTGAATPIEDVARMLSCALGSDLEPNITGTKREGDVRHCTGDPSRIEAELGWSAQVGFSEGIARYADALLEEHER